MGPRGIGRFLALRLLILIFKELCFRRFILLAKQPFFVQVLQLFRTAVHEFIVCTLSVLAQNKLILVHTTALR